MNIEYAERLKRDRKHMWQYVEEYKQRIKYPLHPDTEMRMKNDWLASKNVEDILDGQTDCEENIEKTLNDWSILFRKYTINPLGKNITMIDVPVHDGVHKIMIPKPLF